MKKFVCLLTVLLIGLMFSGCAAHYGCLEKKTATNANVQEEADVANALAKKAQAAQTILAAMERDGNPCYDCPPRVRKEDPAVTEKKLSRYFGGETAPAPSSREEQGENWVFKWEPAGQGYIWIITNPKYLNATPDSSKGEGVYFVGDGQGWFSKSYPMQLVNNEYRVKLRTDKFYGRNRCNYLIMNDSPGDGIWALYGPPDDRTWVKAGDYNEIMHTDKYCIIFQVNSDGTVVPSD